MLPFKVIAELREMTLISGTCDRSAITSSIGFFGSRGMLYVTILKVDLMIPAVPAHLRNDADGGACRADLAANDGIAWRAAHPCRLIQHPYRSRHCLQPFPFQCASPASPLSGALLSVRKVPPCRSERAWLPVEEAADPDR